jgi:hypothetical protein
MGTPRRLTRRLRTTTVTVVAALLVAACGGGAATVENPLTNGSGGQANSYTGPPPAGQDVQAFKTQLWDNVSATSRCGSCHVAGKQAPEFARADDINLAYEAANGVVKLGDPAGSRLVAKVAGGHNCWLASDQACADQLTAWIRNWANATGIGSTRRVQLVAPPDREVGGSKSFPAGPADFAATVHPLLTQYCARCHADTAATPQSPFFAAADVDVAYAAVRSKINLDSPAASRLVLRLRDEFHNCWSDCAQNAAAMENAIRDFAGRVAVTRVDPALVTSKALTLYDGTVASGGSRYDGSVVALYEFKTGTGTVAYDTSGVEPALNLTLSGDVSWVGGWGISIRGGKAQGSTTASRKLHDLLKGSGELSVEAWVAPANVTQEDAYIVSLSGGTTARNFTLGQKQYDYEYYLRTTGTGLNGEPRVATPAAAELVQATLQHVVLTWDATRGRRIYVNGQLVDVADSTSATALSDWNDTFAFVLGNEVSNDRPWQGVLKMVAIHSRALTAAQVRQNFDAGVGERYFLLFNVSSVVDLPRSYVMFEVSQYDSYSYLFQKPVFINLDGAARPDGIRVRGLRIGLNGAEARVGQAYVTMDSVVNASGYDPATGFPLASVGTIVALDKGPGADQFFLTFEQLGARTHVVTEPAPLAPPPPPAGEPLADIGVKVFDEINATMAAVTGVAATDPDVAATFERVRQQLPVSDNLDGLLSSHQVGVAQLAIEYCNALVEDPAARAAMFPGLDFAAPAAQAFGTEAGKDRLIDPLIERMVGQGIATEPTAAEVRGELGALITRLGACAAGCPADRTATIAKAACGAVLGSAVTLLQ